MADYYKKLSLLPPRKKELLLDFDAARAWGKMFKLNKEILHMDLSNNNFDSRELKLMSD